jgi:hypothetical protein
MYVFGTFVEGQMAIVMTLFLSSLFYPVGLCSVFVTRVLQYNLKSGILIPSVLPFLLRIAVAIWVLFIYLPLLKIIVSVPSVALFRFYCPIIILAWE